MPPDPHQALAEYLLEWAAVKAEHRKKLRRLRYAADSHGERTYWLKYKQENPDRVLWNDTRHNLARSLSLPVELIPDELVEAKVAQKRVLREVRERTDAA